MGAGVSRGGDVAAGAPGDGEGGDADGSAVGEAIGKGWMAPLDSPGRDVAGTQQPQRHHACDPGWRSVDRVQAVRAVGLPGGHGCDRLAVRTVGIAQAVASVHGLAAMAWRARAAAHCNGGSACFLFRISSSFRRCPPLA